MRPPPPRFVERLLVPVDGSDASWNALKLALELARAFHAELTVVHVLPVQEFPSLIAEAGGTDEDRGQLLLGEAAKMAKAEGVDVKVVLRKGHIVDQILRVATSTDPSLLVMGTRGLTGARGVLMGSVSQAVLKRSKATVVLVR